MLNSKHKIRISAVRSCVPVQWSKNSISFLDKPFWENMRIIETLDQFEVMVWHGCYFSVIQRCSVQVHKVSFRVVISHHTSSQERKWYSLGTTYSSSLSSAGWLSLFSSFPCKWSFGLVLQSGLIVHLEALMWPKENWQNYRMLFSWGGFKGKVECKYFQLEWDSYLNTWHHRSLKPFHKNATISRQHIHVWCLDWLLSTLCFLKRVTSLSFHPWL